MNLSNNKKMFFADIDRLSFEFKDYLNFIRKQGDEFDRNVIFESWVINTIADLQIALIDFAKKINNNREEMIQTQHPKENIELNRDEKIKNKFQNLPINEQAKLIDNFIQQLKYSYHRKFFENIGPAAIINERWFLQYLTDQMLGA